MGKRINDLTGQTIKNFKIIKFLRRENNQTIWLCKCICGNYKEVSTSTLRKKDCYGCGCMKGKIHKYKYVDKKLYKKWNHMISRCTNESDISYKNYGARGIKVCTEWLNSFDNFYEWAINNQYKEGLEIDRINTNGNYEPSNCRFVTRLDNSRNRRVTLKFNYNGEEKTLKEIAELNNVNYKVLWQRINRDKKDLYEALY